MPDISTELERARRYLLDLSGRNRLLNVPQHNRGKLIRIQDELSREVFRLLVTQGKKMSFDPGEGEQETDEGFEQLTLLSQPLGDDEENEDGVAARHTDTKLQTNLKSEALQRRLLSMFYDARTAIEEQGVNTLFLALGHLKWKEDRNSDIERFAPLILVPVELERTSARSIFKLKALDQDPSDNLSLNAKLAEFGIQTPSFDWGEDFDIDGYFRSFEEAIAAQPGWEVIDNEIVMGFFSFAKFLMFRDLEQENWPEGKELENHALLSGLLGEGFSSGDGLLAEDQDLDELIPVERLNHVVDADSSQALAIEEVRRDRNLIIQGPPGTGKSQTITNLIATAVLDGKSVLFVAEKLAALDVVKRNLDSIGLEPVALELHSHRANKRQVLAELERTLTLGSPRNETKSRVLTRLRGLRVQLNDHASRLNALREPCGRTGIDIVGNLSRLEDGRSEAEIPDLEQAESWSRDDYEHRRHHLVDLQERVNQLGNPSDHPWCGVRNSKLDKFDVEEIIKETTRLKGALEELIPKTVELADRLGLCDPGSIDGTEYYIALAELIGTAPELDKTTLTEHAWRDSRQELKTIISSGRKLKGAKTFLKGRFVDAAWDTDLTQTRLQLAAHGGSFFGRLKGAYRNALAEFRAVLSDPKPPKALSEKLQWLDTLAGAKKEREALRAGNGVAGKSFGSMWAEEASDWNQLEQVVTWIESVFEAGYGPEFLNMASKIEDREICASGALLLKPAMEVVAGDIRRLVQRLVLDLQKSVGAEDPNDVALDQWRSKFSRLENEDESLSRWIAYNARFEQASEMGLTPILNLMETGRLVPDDIEEFFDFAYYKRLYRQLLSEAPELNEFDGESHDRVVAEFRETDGKRIALACYEVLEAHHKKMPNRSGSAGALGILFGEMKRKRGHMPIRKLIAMTGSAIQEIKPVFMMSPLSVAQFLAPGAVEFDLVIFDEASQVEPVDALGAIARGRQLVVVGDNMQLPPTRFFSKIGFSDEEDDDDDGTAKAGDIESILGLAEAKGIRSKMLKWHYRSRHESLIAVSNYEFYDHNLYIVPSPLSSDPSLGLKFRKIDDGLFDRGRSRRNQVEARAVGEAVIEHAIRCPAESLGVAAFSVSQRDAILDELELLRRENPESEPFFQKHPFEPFFVKNLENVQGDQRDVIFISVGYASDTPGERTIPMNFGPLVREGGERRLNVLISRSKNRCVVFSSIDSDQIDLNRSRALGVVALKKFLKYAETGILGVPEENDDRGVDSPFEASVKKALEKHGYVVRTQVGTAGFFIDLAIVDPDQPGRYILGIECDGATYHSARSARERDRQRQAVLERHGWKIHRIWSTDWFQRPQEQLKKVLRAVDAEKEESSQPAIPEEVPEKPIAIQREDPLPDDGEETASPHSTPYEEARFRVSTKKDIHETPLDMLAEIVQKILRVEAPIHKEEVIARVRQLWGVGRAGSRIQQAVEKSIGRLTRGGMAKQSKNFLSLYDTELKIRDRSEVDSPSLRNPDHLPPAEIDHTILTLIEKNHGLAIDETAKVVSQAFGFSSLGKNLRAVIDRRVRSLIRSGEVLETEGFLGKA